MGTNYYLREKHCTACDRSDERHIGKSSAGWCFALHVYPDEGINTLDDWRVRLVDPDNSIRDEYGRPVTVEDLLATIQDRGWDKPPDHELMRQNHATLGPNNLMRHGYTNCVGHGNGTWDYCTGDFS